VSDPASHLLPLLPTSQTLDLATLTWHEMHGGAGDAPAGGEDCRLGVHGGVVYVLVGHDRDDSDALMSVWALQADSATWTRMEVTGTQVRSRAYQGLVRAP
jgi:hypothetical protein